MKSTLAALTFLLAGSLASAQTITHQTVNPNAVTKVSTALNHISLIEMPEPITNAAVGSEDVRIEWHGNTVAIKPLRQNQATNLFLWTEHTQSTYEILPAGDVTSASFVIDQTQSPGLSAKPATVGTAQPAQNEIQKAADTLISQTLLQSSPVGSRGIKDAKDHVNIRINEVVRDKDAVYVRYTVSNPGQHPYRISDPNVFSVKTNSGGDIVAGLRDMQVNDQLLAGFMGASTSQVTLREARLNSRDIAPGQSADGVVCFTKAQTTPQIYQFIFANDETHPIRVTAVL